MPAFARLCALCSTVKPHGLHGYALRYSCELSYHYSFIASPRRFYRLVRRTENNWTRAIRLLSRRSAAGVRGAPAIRSNARQLLCTFLVAVRGKWVKGRITCYRGRRAPSGRLGSSLCENSVERCCAATFNASLSYWQ